MMYFLYFVKDGQIYYFKKISELGNVELSKRLTKRVQKYDNRFDAVIARRELEIVHPEFDFLIGLW